MFSGFSVVSWKLSLTEWPQPINSYTTKSLHWTHSDSMRFVTKKKNQQNPCACCVCTIQPSLISEPRDLRLCFLWTAHGGCRPKWPLRFYETHLPTLPYILLRAINYAGKLLALRGKIAATIWRQPQFLPDPFQICSPAVAVWIQCNAFKVSILHL